ncbi:MAG: thermonuclease family protein [Chloroflexi bacterium]|nr:thermonuclease family protein [Chloroflexota bacterium]
MGRALLVVGLLLLAAACSQTGDAPPPATPTAVASRTVTATAAATTAPADTPGTLLSRPTPAGLEDALVIRVIDGDTIDVLIGGREFRVRYIGIDTPETVDPRRPVECFGREASERNRRLVEGKTVGLERDVSETDRFGRLLRYVWMDPSTGSGQALMVNARLLEEGYAAATAFPPDIRYAELFSALETQARAQGRGLWGPACATPQPSPMVDGPCDFSGTGEPVIKGNISLSTGEKIYHVPGGEFYDRTVIDEAKGERWFCTEAEAVAAGWRKSKL